MQFIIGAAVLLSSLGLLAILARISAEGKNLILFRSDIVSAMTSVAISSGITVGLLLMGFAGQAYFPSALVEVIVLLGFAIVSAVVMLRLARPASHQAPS
ncbi:MAG: hypothetical protein RIC18_10120 [Hoeflea sp.]|uniref:hypothetical protein n=1 Tax=Hoeflea sp. TaxID=1940281 RepID=UPI0032EB89A2